MTLVTKSDYPHGVETRTDLDFHWLEPYRPGEYAVLPENLMAQVSACMGYCDLTFADYTEGDKTISDGIVTGVMPHDPPVPPEPEEPEISQEIKALQEEFADMDAALQAILEVYSDAE